MTFRTGFGYDVHRLREGQELILGGISIPHDKSAIGHSDADVLIHAICDAMLGAANLRDIGFHFPDTSPEFKGIDSKILLKKTLSLINGKGYSLVNMDATVCLEKPRISHYIPQIINALATILETDEENVSIKAKTGEGIGFVGKEEGIEAYVVVLLGKQG
jgi:2-C-methyl-D-erythritol 2,4-cyclodiphosphate synthase